MGNAERAAVEIEVPDLDLADCSDSGANTLSVVPDLDEQDPGQIPPIADQTQATISECGELVPRDSFNQPPAEEEPEQPKHPVIGELSQGVLRLDPDVDTLFERLAQGDERAREKLLVSFMPLARNRALKYAKTPDMLEELDQVAAIGLARALDRFDLARGNKFASFAVPTIDGDIKRYLRDNAWATHVPRGPKELALKVQRTREAFQKNGDSCEISDIAAALETTEDKVLEAQRVYDEAYYSMSFDATLGDGAENEGTLADKTAGEGEEDIFNKLTLSVDVSRALTQVQAHARTIFLRYVVLDETQAQIAEDVGISQMQVSRIIKGVRRQLSESLALAG